MVQVEGLRPSEEFRGEAVAILETQRRRLAELRVPGELSLIGGSSVPGALTRGDVDLHLRVEERDFRAVVDVLRTELPVVHAEIWSSTLATFAVPAPRSTGLAVTPRGLEHDIRFTRSWQLLAADPDLVRAYNAAKLADGGVGDDGYERRKSEFFDRILLLWHDHPAGGRSEQGDR